MNKSILSNTTEWIEVSQKGDTIDQAMENAFKEMRREVGKTFNKPIVSVRTEDVVLIDYFKEQKTEAFLFFFSKRKKVSWNIKLKIKLVIDYIEFKEE